MADFSDFFPLFVRNESDVRDDFNVRANAGLVEGDPDWVDTRALSPFYIHTQPVVIEMALAYDKMNEAVAAAILATSWGEYLDLHAAGFGEERLAATYATGTVDFTGDDGTLIGTGTRVSPPQTDPDVDPPIFETTASGTISGGTLTLAIQAVEPGSAGNVGAGTITLPVTGIDGVTGVSNANQTTDGRDVESDSAMKVRLLYIFKGKGSGTVADYAREALRWPGVGRVNVVPHWAGEGTVRLQLMTETGDPVDGAVVTAFQEYMDPTPGLGHGWAPINHVVTVDTPIVTDVYVSFTAVFRDGYSLDGTAGSVALRGELETAVIDYVQSLQPDDDVVYNHVRAQPFTVYGLLDITDLKIDTTPSPTGTTDIAIAADHVAQPQTVVIS